MTARVLVVDDVRANVKLLEAKLTAEYFEVLTATGGVQALEMVERHMPDIVLLDVMMPGMDGLEVCRRIKASERTHHIPVVMVTALDQPEDRVRGLAAGADDFLTKPVDDTALFCRLRNLVRLKMLTDELTARASTGEHFGFPETRLQEAFEEPGHILLIDTDARLTERITAGVRGRHVLRLVRTPDHFITEASSGHYDLVIVALDQHSFDGLRLCSQLRSLNATRHIPVLVVVEPDDAARLMRAFEIGINDYLMRPVDTNELLARVNTQIRRWRYTESLRNNVQRSIEAAVTDELTGFFNRRYMEAHLQTLMDKAMHRGRPISVLAVDIDYFKMVNDSFGHDAGDMVLRECALRLRQGIRGVDMPCRTGGEEFIIILPDTLESAGRMIAERLRRAISADPFEVGHGGGSVNITVSIGVAGLHAPYDTAERLLKRADLALYEAKRSGRDKVMASTVALSPVAN